MFRYQKIVMTHERVKCMMVAMAVCVNVLCFCQFRVDASFAKDQICLTGPGVVGWSVTLHFKGRVILN